MSDDLGLLMDFLGHEMTIVALLDEECRGHRLERRSGHHVSAAVADFDAVAVHHNPVAVLKIADGIGKRRQCDGVRSQVHFLNAEADRQRRPLARPNEQVFLPIK
jgi:hypothetical protein